MNVLLPCFRCNDANSLNFHAININLDTYYTIVYVFLFNATVEAVLWQWLCFHYNICLNYSCRGYSYNASCNIRTYAFISLLLQYIERHHPGFLCAADANLHFPSELKITRLQYPLQHSCNCSAHWRAFVENYIVSSNLRLCYQIYQSVERIIIFVVAGLVMLPVFYFIASIFCH